MGAEAREVDAPAGLGRKRDFEPFGDFLGRGLLAIEAEREGLDAAKEEVGVLRAKAGAFGVLDEADLVGDGAALDADDTGGDVGVPAEVFGGRVEDDVGAEFDGALDIGGRGGTVDADEGANGLCELDDLADVEDLQEGVAGGLEVDELGLGRELDGLGLGEILEADGDALGLEELGEESVGAAVEVIGRDDLITRVEQARNGGDGRQAAGERELSPAAGDTAALELGDEVLEDLACRVAAAGVVKAPELQGRFLLEGGGLVDWRGGRAEGVVGAGVEGDQFG